MPSSPTYRKAGLQVPAGKEDNYGFFKPTEEISKAWEKTRDIAQVLKAKVIVFHCPAKFTQRTGNIKSMRYFFTDTGGENFIFVWEPRGEWSWNVIAALCEDLDLVHRVDPWRASQYTGN